MTKNLDYYTNYSNEITETDQRTSRKMSVAEGEVSDDRTSRNHNDETHGAAYECTGAAAA